MNQQTLAASQCTPIASSKSKSTSKTSLSSAAKPGAACRKGFGEQIIDVVAGACEVAMQTLHMKMEKEHCKAALDIEQMCIEYDDMHQQISQSNAPPA